MNEPEEQRVIEALRAIPGGLIVTEQDILMAGNQLKDRLQSPPPRRRPALLIAAAAATLLVGSLAWLALDDDEKSDPAPANEPQTPAQALREALEPNAYSLAPDGEGFLAGRAPTAADLAGLWTLRDPYATNLYLMTADGNWLLGAPVNPAQAPHGDYTLADGVLTRSFAPDISCPTSGWAAAIASDSSLRLEFSTGENMCTPADNREVWDRLAPGPAPLMDYFRASAADAEFVAPRSSFALSGVFVGLDTGEVLDVADDGTYALYHDVREWESGPSGTGTLELARAQGGIDGTCGPPERGSLQGTVAVTRLPRVKGFAHARQLLRMDVEGCAFHGTTLWVRVSS